MKTTPRRARPNHFTRKKTHYKNKHAPALARMPRLLSLCHGGIAARVVTPLRYHTRWNSPLCHENSRSTHENRGERDTRSARSMNEHFINRFLLTDRQSSIALSDTSLHVAFLAYGSLNA